MKWWNLSIFTFAISLFPSQNVHIQIHFKHKKHSINTFRLCKTGLIFVWTLCREHYWIMWNVFSRNLIHSFTLPKMSATVLVVLNVLNKYSVHVNQALELGANECQNLREINFGETIQYFRVRLRPQYCWYYKMTKCCVI